MKDRLKSMLMLYYDIKASKAEAMAISCLELINEPVPEKKYNGTPDEIYEHIRNIVGCDYKNGRHTKKAIGRMLFYFLMVLEGYKQEVIGDYLGKNRSIFTYYSMQIKKLISIKDNLFMFYYNQI